MSKLKTNVYYVESVGGAVIEEENEMNEGFLYIKKGTEGTYDPINEIFETEEGEDCSVEAKYVDIDKTDTLY
jgi:hypothetical protein